MSRENSFLFRVPLLDAKQHVIGYRLAFQGDGAASETSGGAGADLLLTLVAGRSGENRSGLYFMETGPAGLSDELVQTLSPPTAVLVLKPDDLLAENHLALASSFREKGGVLALRDASPDLLKANGPLLPHLSYIFLPHGHPDLGEIADWSRRRQPDMALIVDAIPGWREFEACTGSGIHGVFQNLCAARRETSSPGKLGPQAQQILQLMHMVQGDADIRHLEKVLKSDVALSYKLLRYINSAGFGLEFEIDSPRHAVAMLGYAPMFRWLLLLLVRTNTVAFSPALMQAAMVRGRFAELLGQGFLSRREAENLFVVGMFSFLDHLLGIPVQEVLKQLTLPETVSQALLSREGVYGPVLALVEACEQVDGRAAHLAQALSMTAAHVNEAHLSALAWAQNIKL
ncbi:MAG: HDOD domain-containing protein [Polaromonas sp.]|uniref:EAL and HDOD domain-containing protein n=1 Tax=Polaromonas sp. TaxID=1869339 RepID=UPI00248A2E09|nr:HDOD domain-containing protein [Polaromonas sp.]MDI1239433.1 HDOD domain-containing protein [Polaromonas sp.]